MAYGDITQLTGRSGAVHTFYISPKSVTFRAKPGVYVMAKDVGTNRYEFCYVGETADMSVRPFAPEKLDCFNRFGVDSILHLEEFDANKRKSTVSDLVQAYAPSCNTL